MTKKFLCTCLMIILSISVVSGCGNKAEQTTQTNTPTTADAKETPSSGEAAGNEKSANEEPATEEPADESSNYFKKYDPVITLTQNMLQTSASDMQWYDGENIESNAYTKWVEETCGVKFKAKWIVSDNESDVQKLNIAAASNDLPDMITGSTGTIAKLIKAGLVMPLDDLIAEYASPLTKYIIDSSVEQSKGNLSLPFTVDGKIYAYSVPLDNPGFWVVNWIRKDILDELGKPVPETLSQLEDVLAAYKAKYPDRYGLPLDKDSDLNFIMSAFNAANRSWYMDDSNTIVYGSIQPEVKEALALLRDWYAKGYIDQEFIAKNGEKVMEDFTRGDFLCWGPGAWWNVLWPFPDLWANVPDAEMINLPILKGDQGQQLRVVRTVDGAGVAINTKCKNPEAVVYVFNESVDSFYRSEDFVLEDMEKIGYKFKYPYTEKQNPLNADDPDRIMNEYNYEVQGYGFFNKGRSHPNTTFGFKGDLPQLYQNILAEVADIAKTGVLEGHSVDGQNEYISISEIPQSIESFIPMYEYWEEFQHSDNLRPSMMICSPTETYVEKAAFLSTMEKETFARIIMGSLPLDSFEKFVEDWKSNGGEQIAKELNDWYESTK